MKISKEQSWAHLMFWGGMMLLVWGMTVLAVLRECKRCWEEAHEEYFDGLRASVQTVKGGVKSEMYDACKVGEISSAVVMDVSLRNYADSHTSPFWGVGLGLSAMLVAAYFSARKREQALHRDVTALKIED